MFLAEVMPGDDPARRYEDAIAAFAAMAGALTLARAVSDETLSDLILKTTAKRLCQNSPNSDQEQRECNSLFSSLLPPGKSGEHGYGPYRGVAVGRARRSRSAVSAGADNPALRRGCGKSAALTQHS